MQKHTHGLEGNTQKINSIYCQVVTLWINFTFLPFNPFNFLIYLIASIT